MEQRGRKRKDEASMMRDRFVTLAPLRITILKEHLLQCFTDEEVNTVNESCYGKFALCREILIVFCISFHKSPKNGSMLKVKVFSLEPEYLSAADCVLG